MNKFLAWILAIIFVFAFAGCGNSTDVEKENDSEAVVNSENADTENTDTDKADADKADADKADEEQPLTPEEEQVSKEAIQQAYEETMENIVWVKRSELVKRYDDDVKADGLDEQNYLSNKPVEVSGTDTIPESMTKAYPDVKKRYRYSTGVTSDGTEFMSLDILTDADDNILYLSSQIPGTVWNDHEDIRNYYMAQCGQLIAGFMDCEFEEGYEKAVETYNAASTGEEHAYMHWNDYRYFMSNSGESGYVGFIIQAPFVE